jgi:Prohead core protein serine protease
MMKLLREVFDPMEYLWEGEGDKKNLYLRGPFLQGAIPNRNKRIYPEEVLTKETNRYIAESVHKKTAWGELNHPQGPNINLDRVCLRTVDLIKEGTNFIGKAIVTPTPMGDIVKGLQAAGGRLGVSSRALGSLKPWAEDKGISEVQNDLRILAIDCVGDPSAPDAWVDGIMENIEYFYSDQTGDIAEAAKQAIRETPKNQLTDERKLELFEHWLEEVARKIARKPQTKSQSLPNRISGFA